MNSYHMYKNKKRNKIKYHAVKWSGQRLFLKRTRHKGGSARTIPPV